MKKLFFALSAFTIIAFASCHDKAQSAVAPALTGGKGGRFSIALSSTNAGTPVAAKVYIKYAANREPDDISGYNDVKTATVDPVRFDGLTEGVYFIKSTFSSYAADTFIVLGSGSVDTTGVNLILK